MSSENKTLCIVGQLIQTEDYTVKLEGCNVSDLTSARPKVDYEADIGVRRLLLGERWEKKKKVAGVICW